MYWKTWSPRVLRKTEEPAGNCRVSEASTARASGQDRKRDGWCRKSEKVEKSVMYNHITPRIILLFHEVGQTSWSGPSARRERLIPPACRPSSCPYSGKKAITLWPHVHPSLPCALPSHALHVVFKAPLADWAKLSLLACIHFSTERQEGKWTPTTNGRHSPIRLLCSFTVLVSTADLVTPLWVPLCFQPRVPQPAPSLQQMDHSLHTYIKKNFFFLRTKAYPQWRDCFQRDPFTHPYSVKRN